MYVTETAHCRSQKTAVSPQSTAAAAAAFAVCVQYAYVQQYICLILSPRSTANAIIPSAVRTIPFLQFTFDGVPFQI